MKMNIHKDKMLWYNTRYCIGASYERRLVGPEVCLIDFVKMK